MEQRFSNESIDLVTLREFCEQEGEAVMYRKGDQLEREGDPARWLAYVTEGCFKYVTHGLSDDRDYHNVRPRRYGGTGARNNRASNVDRQHSH